MVDTEAACNLAVGEPWGQGEACRWATLDVLEPPSLAEREEFNESIRVIYAAFPDVDAHIDEVIDRGETAAPRTHATAPHTGDFFGLAPTGTAVMVGCGRPAVEAS